MAMDFTRLKFTEKEECVAKKREMEMHRKGSVKKAFGTLRESFRSQSPKEEVEASIRQNASVRRIWRK
jgi:hypothetical protein